MIPPFRNLTIGAKLFEFFTKCYQHQFISLFSSDEMRQQFVLDWSLYLSDVAPHRITLGCKKIKDPLGKYCNHPPNMMQFKALCLPDELELNIPTFEEAFKHALTHSKYVHPFITVITKKLDLKIIRQFNEKDARSQFKIIYELARKQFLREGNILPKLESCVDFPSQAMTEEDKQKIYEKERLAAEKQINRYCEIMGLPKKYTTSFEIRDAAINHKS